VEADRGRTMEVIGDEEEDAIESASLIKRLVK
jgi:hypothetical protein